MHCPRCHAEPPRDPFICTSCGEQLLTFLDEPLGPGSGVRREGLAVGAGAQREAIGTAAGPRVQQTAGQRGSDQPVPGRPVPGQPGAPQPRQPSDITGALVGRIVFGLCVGMIMLLLSPMAGLLTMGATGLLLWRWPRWPFILYAIAVVGVAATLGLLIEIVDFVDPEDFFPGPEPTATIEEFATSTPVGTPTLVPAMRTATATVVLGESRVQVAHASARWKRGDNQGALAALEQALRLTPGQPGALNLRALVRIAAGDYAGAAQDGQRVTTAQPAVATYHDTYGYALLKLGRYREAADEYERAIDGLQGDSRAASLLGRGLALVGLARLDDAARDIQAGLRLVPDIDPDPQLTDLETSARRALAGLPIGSPVASPAASPAPSPGGTPGPSPAASPAGVPGRAP